MEKTMIPASNLAEQKALIDDAGFCMLSGVYTERDLDGIHAQSSPLATYWIGCLRPTNSGDARP